MNRMWIWIAGAATVAGLLQGCAAVMVTGAAATALVVSDRRTTGTYVEDESIEWKVIDRMRGKFPGSHVNAASYNRRLLLVGQIPTEEAKKQGKQFGLFFDNIEGGFTTTNRGAANAFNVLPNVVYCVYTDGRPLELVRGVDLIGTPLAAFGKILATGDKPDVFNGICGAESGGVPVSASSPALLVGEVEVQKKAQSQEALPILPAPPRARKS